MSSTFGARDWSGSTARVAMSMTKRT